VLVYCRNMLDCLGLDEDEIVMNKMTQNEAKYPVEKARGAAHVSGRTDRKPNGGKTLDPDQDYMVYTKDGDTLIQGIGDYAGSIVLDD